MVSPDLLDTPHGTRVAYHLSGGESPIVVFLGGFLSDMAGTKALALESHCRTHGRAFLRLDYSGHGESSGEFADGTIGLWRDDALAVIDAVAEGPLVVVGSSMGGWIALLVALARKDRVAGIIGVAAAPDFTDKLMWEKFTETQRKRIMEDGAIELASGYDAGSYAVSRGLIEEGRSHNLLDGAIALDIPVRLIHGMRDEEVPCDWSLKIAERLTGDDVEVTLVKGGGHSLSGERDLARLASILEGLLGAL